MAKPVKVNLGEGVMASFDDDTLIIKGKQGANIDLDAQTYDNLLDFNAAQDFDARQFIGNDINAFWDTEFADPPELAIHQGPIGSPDNIAFGPGDIDQLNAFITATNPDWFL